MRAALWGGVIVAEAALAVAVAAGLPGARGRRGPARDLRARARLGDRARPRGAPCGCFGARSRIGWPAVARTALLAGAFAALRARSRTRAVDGRVARNRARRRARRPSSSSAWPCWRSRARSASCGSRSRPRPRSRSTTRARRSGAASAWSTGSSGPRSVLAAVFSSPGCALCHALEPSLRLVASDPEVELEVFDEEADAEVWRDAGDPRQPYAVALGPDGEVLAKGTFNSLYQLESVLRRAHRGPRVFSDAVTEASSRRGFLARAGRLLLAVGSGGFVAAALRAQKAEAYHFCGHIYTTGSCPHPTGLPRIDGRGFPLRAADGHAVDDLGRPIDKAGRPVDANGELLRDPDGQPASAGSAHAHLPERRARARVPRLTSTARGTAAAAVTSAGSSTAAATCATGSTAMPRSPATATRAGTCSASCTTTRRSGADRRPRADRIARRARRCLVALKPLDGRHRECRTRSWRTDSARRSRGRIRGGPRGRRCADLRRARRAGSGPPARACVPGRRGRACRRCRDLGRRRAARPPAGPLPGAGALAPVDAVAAGALPLRRPARNRGDDLRPGRCWLGAAAALRRTRERPGRDRDRPELRSRAGPARARARGARRDEGALAERPQGLRALRVLAAGSLALALVAGEARAATPVASPGGDPSVAGADLVWQEPGLSGFLLRDGEQTQLPGTDPALGGANIAWRSGDTVTVADRETLAPTLQETVPGVEKLAVSDRWLVYRVRLANGSEQIRAFSLADPDEHDGHQPVAGGRTTRPPVARPRRGRLPPGDARREPPALLRPRYRKAPRAPLVAKGATAEPGPDRREAALRARRRAARSSFGSGRSTPTAPAASCTSCRRSRARTPATSQATRPRVSTFRARTARSRPRGSSGRPPSREPPPT